jgi:hypothetical protein
MVNTFNNLRFVDDINLMEEGGTRRHTTMQDWTMCRRPAAPMGVKINITKTKVMFAD